MHSAIVIFSLIALSSGLITKYADLVNYLDLHFEKVLKISAVNEECRSELKITYKAVKNEEIWALRRKLIAGYTKFSFGSKHKFS